MDFISTSQKSIRNINQVFSLILKVELILILAILDSFENF